MKRANSGSRLRWWEGKWGGGWQEKKEVARKGSTIEISKIKLL